MEEVLSLPTADQPRCHLISRVEDLKSSITYLRRTVTALAVALGVAVVAFIVFLIHIDLTILG